MDFINKIINEPAETGLLKLNNESVNCCVTSPPYYGLRDYGVEGQLGLEKTPEEYINKLVEIFSQVKRVLKNNGTLWLNIGDSYARNGGKGTNYGYKHMQGIRLRNNKAPAGLKEKDLIGIPWMLAFALRNDGWYLRQDIIWHKPNPMPESVTDRCTKSHEYIFLLSKNKKYYYDHKAIMQPLKDESVKRLIQDIENQKGSNRVPGKTNGNIKASCSRKGEFESDKIGLNGSNFKSHKNFLNKNGELIHGVMANKKDVWTVTTKPSKEAHFAIFPQDLIVDCIKAGCPQNGIVLDPFMGSGTTAIVARKLQRNYIGFELNPDYIKLSEKRILKELGIFA